jgi:hypothetical protein
MTGPIPAMKCAPDQLEGLARAGEFVVDARLVYLIYIAFSMAYGLHGTLNL